MFFLLLFLGSELDKVYKELSKWAEPNDSKVSKFLFYLISFAPLFYSKKVSYDYIQLSDSASNLLTRALISHLPYL